MKKEINIPVNALVILVGVAGSGKSTLARKIFGKEGNTVIVSSDACRKELTGDEENQERNPEVFALFHQKIREALTEGRRVIADATNLSKMARKPLYEIASEAQVPVYAIVFNFPLPLIKRQNQSRERKVPEDVIDKQFEKLANTYKELDEELPGRLIDIVPEKTRKHEAKKEEQDKEER